jgi:cyclic pyranopterin phosphate synthase
MPLTDVTFRPRDELLTFEEIVRFTKIAVDCGVDSVRLTGGEPLVRADLATLVGMLRALDGLRDLSLTTNAILLNEQAAALRAAGLDRLNISLDTLKEETFQQIARREGLDRVLSGIATAQEVGFDNIRLNALAIRDLTEVEIVDLVRFARERDMEMRFIEFMPLDAENSWNRASVLSGAEIRRRIEAELGQLVPRVRADASQPAVDYSFEDGKGTVGFINPVTEPFCGDCNRLRLTAEGQIRNCLFSTAEWDVRKLLRSAASDEDIERQLIECVQAKKAGHGIDSDRFTRPDRAMYQIGG